MLSPWRRAPTIVLPFCVSEVEEQSVRNVKLVGEEEDASSRPRRHFSGSSHGSSMRLVNIAVWMVVESTDAPEVGSARRAEEIFSAFLDEVLLGWGLQPRCRGR